MPIPLHSCLWSRTSEPWVGCGTASARGWLLPLEPARQNLLCGFVRDMASGTRGPGYRHVCFHASPNQTPSAVRLQRSCARRTCWNSECASVLAIGSHQCCTWTNMLLAPHARGLEFPYQFVASNRFQGQSAWIRHIATDAANSGIRWAVMDSIGVMCDIHACGMEPCS